MVPEEVEYRGKGLNVVENKKQLNTAFPRDKFEEIC
jgi:hypothetical protein